MTPLQQYGIAKDLNKMSAKSALKGVGFFLASLRLPALSRTASVHA